jgi:beta-lactamase regulating signal transducer with metallopeptidase domain
MLAMNALLHIGLTNAVMATVLAVAAAAAGKLLRRPALGHALWLLVLVKLVTPPLVIVPIAWPEQPAVSAVAEFTDPPAAPEAATAMLEPEGNVPQPERWTGPVGQLKSVEELVQPDEPPFAVPEPLNQDVPPTATVLAATVAEVPWLTVMGFAWLAGSCAWFGVALMRIWRFQQVLRAGRPAPAEFQREASSLGAHLGLRDCPVVWLVPGVVSPLLWAVSGYPRLLVPAGLLVRLNALQRRTLLAHELAHYRRRDHWVRCLEFLALGIYWWLPVVWWARRKLREAEEECCDGWVLWTLPEAAKAYASALVETLDFLSGSQPALPPVASGLGQLDLLRRRLAMIMLGKMPQRLGGLGFLAVLGLAALLLPLWPTWAQQNATSSTSKTTTSTSGTVNQQATDPTQASQNLEKARAELERAQQELERLRMQLDEMRRAFEVKARKLQTAQAELQKNLALGAEAAAKQTMTKGQAGFSFGGKGVVDPEALKRILEQAVKSQGDVNPEALKKIIEVAFKLAQAEGEKAKGGFGGFGGGSGVTGGGFGGMGGGGAGFGIAGGTPAMEKRISDLERKLDRVLEELHAIRDAMPAAKKRDFPTPR